MYAHLRMGFDNMFGAKGKCTLYFVTWSLFPPSGHFRHLLITFANSLDPDQAWQIIRPSLDPNCLMLWWYDFFEKLNLKKKRSADDESMPKYSACRLLIAFANSLDPDQAWQKIWSQTVWHSDGEPERIFQKS